MQRFSFTKSFKIYWVLGMLIALGLKYGNTASALETDIVDGVQKYALLGECQLENGQTIYDCRLGYRTYGALNEDKSNVILVPTWFTGTSENHSYLADLNLLDPASYFIVIVDSFGNGVSSSPSNSDQQPGASFPVITIRDMIDAQHRLLTDELGIDSLYAAVGLSMGGMQVFEWAVRYPGFAKNTIAAIGSPRLSSFDIILWETRNRLLALYRDCECEDAIAALQGVGWLGQVPEKLGETVSREKAVAELSRSADERLSTLTIAQTWDEQRQAEAMMTHNIALGFGNDMTAAAEAVQTNFLIIASPDDRVVTPAPALEFGALVDAEIKILDQDCGHGDPWCSPDEFATSVRDFLQD